MDFSSIDLAEILSRITTLITDWGLKVLGALVVLIVGRMIAKSIRKGVTKALERGKMDPTLIPFMSSLTYYMVMAFVLIAVLGMVGIQTASMIALLGAAGLAVGLALQGTMANFASGVMLLIFRPFQKGDFIEAAGVAGSVDTVGIFTTTLNTPDNVRIVLPNGTVWGQTIKNYATNATRRVDMVMGISYDDDIGAAIDTINKVLGNEPRLLQDPAPTVAVAELADSSVNIVVRPWCKKEDYWGVKFDLTRAFKEQLEAGGCSIPYPQTDVHLHKVPENAA
jgi:small conductance mechanosensitive channel